MSQRCLLLVGTKKGAFILELDEGRSKWSIRGPFIETWGIHDMSVDPASGAILAGGANPWYGPAVWQSPDLGETWTHSSEGLTYGDGDDAPKLKTVWNVIGANGSLFAGVEPAGLFRSDDAGATWSHVAGLRDHPSRPEWQPGAGGLICHTIIPHPSDPDRMWIAISAVGTFETRDGGTTWETRNKGVRADYIPGPEPDFGQCVHKLIRAAGEDETLLQQNHLGVYRSANGGVSWDDITPGLPSRFGFVMAGHPRDAATAWVIPLDGDDKLHVVPEGSAAVWRTRDSGGTWTRHGEGLPAENAYVQVLREAMAVDRLDPVGVYFGTSGGRIYGSVDEGASWSVVVDDLPPIWSVETHVVEA